MFILGVIPDNILYNITIQRRIQDLSEVESPILPGEGGGGANIRFCQIFLKTA